jgi:hypothetical protein
MRSSRRIPAAKQWQHVAELPLLAEPPVRGAAAIQPLSRVVRTCLRWRRLERRCCGSRLCIAASDTMWFVRGQAAIFLFRDHSRWQAPFYFGRLNDAPRGLGSRAVGTVPGKRAPMSVRVFLKFDLGQLSPAVADSSARQLLFIVTATLRTSFPSGMMVTD